MPPVAVDIVGTTSVKEEKEKPRLKHEPSQIGSTCFADELKVYYERLFPVNIFYKWLSYGRDPSEGYFVNREFSFTLDGDVYLRYLAFKDNKAFKAELVGNNPIKIDLGAVYDNLSDKQNRKPVDREYVLDIDMTDFDDVRVCCKEADICSRCWPFMTIAIRCLHRALTEDFGFQHLLWVYSGRRGIHCWVADRLSRQMNTSSRAGLTSYLDVLTEPNPKRPKIVSKLHPSLEKSLVILREYMDDMVVTQQRWSDSSEWWTKILRMYMDNEKRDDLEKRLMEEEDGATRWEIFKEFTDKQSSRSKKHYFYFEEVLFHLLYPRLDVNVSTGLNHLLKAPFCLHPKTNRVCVPIDVEHVDEFDPFKVPTGSSLMKDLESYSKDDDTPDVKKTSLKPYVEHFGNFVKRLLAKAPKHPGEIEMDF